MFAAARENQRHFEGVVSIFWIDGPDRRQQGTEQGSNLRRRGSSGSSVVVTQHAAESLAARYITEAFANTILGLNQRVAQTLVVPLRVVMLGEVADGTTKGPLAEEDHPVDALAFR